MLPHPSGVSTARQRSCLWSDSLLLISGCQCRGHHRPQTRHRHLQPTPDVGRDGISGRALIAAGRLARDFSFFDTWLSEYRDISLERSRTFELAFRIVGDASDAFTQETTLVVSLPWVAREPKIGVPLRPPRVSEPGAETSHGAERVGPSLAGTEPWTSYVRNRCEELGLGAQWA